jgi:hypothetical protein
MILNRSTYQEKTKDGSDQASQIESPLPANDVDCQSEAQSANRETSIGTSEDRTSIGISDAHLLIDGCGDQADTLRPRQVEEVPETTQEPDAYLIAAKSEVV